jgi:SAM-dependent methyltransferase
LAQAEGVVIATLPCTTADGDPRLAEQGRRWREKPVLRALYTDLYRRMAAACVPGRTVEVGGGSGDFKEFAPDVVSTDILPAPWLDLRADAQHLPFAAGSVANIVMFDVLHHIEFPMLFLTEAARVLAPGGRLVFCEPAITLASWPFYKFIHPEPVRWQCDPLAVGRADPRRDAFVDANQAIPTLLLSRDRTRLGQAVPALEALSVDWLSLFAYPLSGGFQSWSLVPPGAVAMLLKVEDRIPRWVRRWAAFRLIGVFARNALSADVGDRRFMLP